MFTRSETLYRQAAAEGATHVGLLIVVYDTLAGDLRRAGSAVLANDVVGRCQASNHALLLLGHLESWTKLLDDSALADSLLQFYAYLRAQLLLQQAHLQVQAFFDLATLVEQTRATWQMKQTQTHTQPAEKIPQQQTAASWDVDSQTRSTWSA